MVPKVGSQGWDRRLGPKVGFQGWVPRLGPKVGSHGWVPWLGPMVGSHGWVPRLGPKVGSQAWVPWLGQRLVGSKIDLRIVMMHTELKMVKRGPNGTWLGQGQGVKGWFQGWVSKFGTKRP